MGAGVVGAECSPEGLRNERREVHRPEQVCWNLSSRRTGLGPGRSIAGSVAGIPVSGRDRPWDCSHQKEEPRHLVGNAGLVGKPPCTDRRARVSARRGARHALAWVEGTEGTSVEMARWFHMPAPGQAEAAT